jgi:gp16 family phage-associated protein
MTPDQVRKKFKREGKTIKSWALEHSYDPNRVYRILGGFEKCEYGASHEIAVKLGLKKDTKPGASGK